MNFTPEEEAMGDRLTKYNGRAYNPVTEPYGFDRGGNQQGVFEAMLKDVAGFGRAIARIVGDAVEAARQTALDRSATSLSAKAAFDSEAAASQSAAAAHADASSVNGPAIAAGILRARRAAFFYSRVR